MSSIDKGISFPLDECVRQFPKLAGNLIRGNSFRLKLCDQLAQPLERLVLPRFARRSRFTPVQYYRASTPLQVQPAFVRQEPVCLSDCIEVNPEIDCQLPHSRYLIARLKRAVDEQVTHGIDNLPINWNRRVQIYCDRGRHCLLYIFNIQYLSRTRPEIKCSAKTVLRVS